MADTRTEKTVADELREAAHELRTIAQFVIGGPWRWEGKYPQRITNGQALLVAETFTGPEVSPYEAQWITLVSPELAEPLASWLKQTASDYEVEVNPRVSGRDRTQPFCDRCGLWLVQVCTDQELCSCWDDALAVARALNGGAQ